MQQKIGSEKYLLKNNKTLILRNPLVSDVDDLLSYINGLVEEDVMILRNKKVKRSDEVKWLNGLIKKIKNGEEIALVAEVNKQVIGRINVEVGSFRETHFGTLGISIAPKYRNMGIGRIMLNKIIKESKKSGLKSIQLEVFSKNKRASHLYKSVGFKRAGVIPKKYKYKGKYEDGEIMYMKI